MPGGPLMRKDMAIKEAERRIEACTNSLREAIVRNIQDRYREGDEIIISDITGTSSVYDCFYSMNGGALARRAEMDEAIRRIRGEFERLGWETYFTYPVTFWRKRMKTHLPRLVLK
jgi:hypothetical protein